MAWSSANRSRAIQSNSRRGGHVSVPRSSLVVPAFQHPGVTLTQSRQGTVTTVTAVSRLSGTVYYHWYLDGAYVAAGTSAVQSFVLEDGEQVRIAVLDTTDPNFDGIANAPAGYPARRVIRWVRSIAANIVSYKIEQFKDADPAVQIALVPHEASRWSYSLVSGLLVDLASYNWQITPIDANGNDALVVNTPTEKIVRTPDAPQFTAAFDAATTKVTFAAAA